jgi:hypothetical protein
MSPDHPEPSQKRLLGAILRDAAEYIGASNTYEALRGDFSEIRRAWKTLLIILLIVSGSIWFVVADHYSSSHAEEERALAADYNRKVGERNRETEKLRFELQATRAERDKAQLELQPWKERAKKEFPFDDVTSALAKLDAKTETVLAMFRSSIVNPLNEPIIAATCTVSIETNADTGDGSLFMSGAYAAYGTDGAALLVARSSTHLILPKGKFEFTAPASVFDVMMNKPVNTLTTAQFIQIGFHEEALKGVTEVLGGSVVWVINNRISLRYSIPPQPLIKQAKELRIFVRDLRAGIEQFEQFAKQHTMQPTNDRGR